MTDLNLISILFVCLFFSFFSKILDMVHILKHLMVFLIWWCTDVNLVTGFIKCGLIFDYVFLFQLSKKPIKNSYTFLYRFYFYICYLKKILFHWHSTSNTLYFQTWNTFVLNSLKFLVLLLSLHLHNFFLFIHQCKLFLQYLL